MNLRPWAALACGLTAAVTATTAHAGDAACAPVLKAVRAGMAQPRIHAAIDHPLDAEALKMGMKPMLMHSIVIDQQQYSNAMHPQFRKTALDASTRTLATDLATFEIDTGCKSLGTQTAGGQPAQAYAVTADLGRGEARITLWVDNASGLPVRAFTDEPDIDVDTEWKPSAKGKADKELELRERPSGKRLRATHAYLYGNAVKPPGPQGAVDPAALAALRALLKP